MLDEYRISDTPYMHKTNARYRGPIESNKMYGYIEKDLQTLFKASEDTYNRLLRYAKETFEGGTNFNEENR